MKKIILLLCIIAAAQSVRAEEFEHDLFNDEAPIALDFEVHKEPEQQKISFADYPKLAAVYAYYNYVKPLLVAVKIMEDEEGVAG